MVMQYLSDCSVRATTFNLLLFGGSELTQNFRNTMFMIIQTIPLGYACIGKRLPSLKHVVAATRKF